MHNLLCLLNFRISIQFKENLLEFTTVKNEPVISWRVIKDIGKECNVFQDAAVFLCGVCGLPGTDCLRGQF